jgi:dTMP kinase
MDVGAGAGTGTPGFLAVIDGPTGVGKTTVTKLAAGLLAERDLPTITTGQPSESPMGRLAGSSTRELHGLPLSLLMAADRYYHQDHVLTPALQAGQVVICDRYVTTAMVLDQLDGVEPRFIWEIYRYLRWPDVAVMLTGDPALCRARAASRGVYSRFHDGGITAGETEAALYARCAKELASQGYPVRVMAIGDRSAAQVADAVSGLIQDRMTAMASTLGLTDHPADRPGPRQGG